MSFFGTTDVAKHLERKFRASGRPPATIIPIREAQSPDLKLQPERPASPAPAVQDAPRPDSSR